MHKRKASADGNVRQKTPTRRPSASSLKTRANTAQQQVRTEKSSSNQNVFHAVPKLQPQNATDAYTPKTRFTSQDRGKDFVSPSPRLKYFPAEKIKKLDSSPAYTPDPIGAIIMQQNPQESGTFYVPGSVDQNNGQGDANAALHPVPQPRQHQTMHTMSQQQVGSHQPVHQLGQVNPTSDPTLYQQAQANQVYRPCVPHGQREPSPQKTPRPLYRTATPQPSTPMPPPPSTVSAPLKPEQSKVENNGTECPDYEGQPVGGRNAAMYRQAMIASQQPQAQSQMSMMPNVSQSNSSQQYQHPAQNHYQVARQPNPQNPQVSYQQLQQTAAQQQQMQQRALAYQAQMTNSSAQKNQVGAMGQGMTSPQEAAANKYRAMQNYQAQQTNYAMNPQSSQLNSYTINVVNNRQPQFAPPNMQQHPMQQYQSPPVQPSQNPGQQVYRNPAGYHVGNPGYQAQKNPAENASQQPPSSQQAGQLPVQPPANPGDQEKEAKLSFTPSMIRDQEKLVATMKQQGVPFDIIKRQFEALLNEQRRQLEYIQDLRRQDYLPEIERPVAVTRRYKQSDEKPEWMVHLTPQRLSYVEVEKMHEKQKQKEQMTRQMDESRENEMANRIHQHNQQQYQYYQQGSQQQPSQQPNQQPNQQPQQMFAQPRMIGWAQSTPNVTTMNHPQSFPSHQYQQHAYSNTQQQNPQLHLYQQVYPANHQQIEKESPNNPTTHEAVKRTTEPSSLLKLRVYKDCIRPQGRNNGLQDPQIVRKYLEQASVSAEVQRGLEYLASLGPKKQIAKLNGMQERMEMEHQLNERLAAASSQQSPKRISANGLENARNPNNPPSQRLTQLKKANQEFLREYPRQKQANPQDCHVVQAERENGTVAPVEQHPCVQQHSGHAASTPMIPYNDRNLATAGSNLMPYRFDGSNPQYYQQMQQYYQNARNLAKNIGEGDMGFARKNDVSKNAGFDRAGGDATGNMNGQTPDGKISMYRTHHSQPDLYEARSIGGVRYLARKQDYMPNTQLVSPETLMASRHLHPPMIY